MVNHLNTTFQALADPTRRQMIIMLMEQETCTIKTLAAPFAMSLAAISKHVTVLENANLVARRKIGRENHLSLNPAPLAEVKDWLGFYEKFWHQKFDELEKLFAAKPVGKNRGDVQQIGRPKSGTRTRRKS